MEDKIKIELKKKPTSAFKIGDTTIKIIPWLESKYIAFVIGETLKTFKKSIEAGDNDETTLTVSLLTMEMLLAEVATNLDITDLSADDIGATGLFNAIHEKLLNYDTIKSAVLAGMDMVGDGLIANALEKNAPEKSLEEMKEMLEDYKTSEKIQGLIETMLANNPYLAKELEKTLTPSGEENGNQE